MGGINMKFFGLIPAGGTGSRLGNIPCSKEVFPIVRKTGNTIVRSTVCENLIRYYRLADITNIYFIIRSGKWDIPAYLQDGRDHGVNIAYLIMNLPYGTPFTLDQAYPFVRGNCVALGFPDMICTPENLFARLREKLFHTDADVVLGLNKVESYKTWDMIEFNGDKITDIVIKEDRPDLIYGWSNAVWGPAFTEFLHEYLAARVASNDFTATASDGTSRELYVGDVIRAAIQKGYKVEYVTFENGTAIDLGIPETLEKFLKG